MKYEELIVQEGLIDQNKLFTLLGELVDEASVLADSVTKEDKKRILIVGNELSGLQKLVHVALIFLKLSNTIHNQNGKLEIKKSQCEFMKELLIPEMESIKGEVNKINFEDAGSIKFQDKLNIIISSLCADHIKMIDRIESTESMN